MPFNTNSSLQLDWEVKEQALQDGTGAIFGYKSLRRSDTDEVLNVCNTSYKVLSNSSFNKLTEEVVEAGNGAYELSDITEWKNGRIIMAQFKRKKDINLCGWDSHNYLNIGHSHDGSMSIFGGHSNLLLRCTNQFGSLMKKISIRHTASMERRLNEFVHIIEKYEKKQRHFEIVMEKGYNVTMSKDLMNKCIDVVLGIEDRSDISTQKANQVDALMNSINIETADVGTNLFGLFNGVTHYTTHVRNGASKGSHLLGGQVKLTDKAFDFVENRVLVSN